MHYEPSTGATFVYKVTYAKIICLVQSSFQVNGTFFVILCLSALLKKCTSCAQVDWVGGQFLWNSIGLYFIGKIY